MLRCMLHYTRFYCMLLLCRVLLYCFVLHGSLMLEKGLLMHVRLSRCKLTDINWADLKFLSTFGIKCILIE